LVGLALAVATATLGGCSGSHDPSRPADGRACQAVPFDAVQKAIGVRFDTSSPAHVDQTWSCVLSVDHASFPDLTIVLSATTADELIFRASLWPSGAAAVDGLGRIAYQVTLPPATGQDGSQSGPGLRVGWLSAAPQSMTLRYTWPAGATDDEIAALTPKIIDFAKAIERQIVGG
jgi:hypothetical protein